MIMKALCLRWLQTPFQIVLLAAIWLLADTAVRTLHLPLPANLTGMLLLLACILLGVVKAEWFSAGARWLLAEMLLFFVPAVVAVVNYQALLLQEGAHHGGAAGEHYAGARYHGAGGGPGLPPRTETGPPESPSCLIPCSG